MDSQLLSYLAQNPTCFYAIKVDINEQRCYVYNRNSEIHKIYPVSTSRYGVSSKEGSNCTPTGLQIINDCIGNDAPLGMVFRGRVATGEIVNIESKKPALKNEHDYVLTRIL